MTGTLVGAAGVSSKNDGYARVFYLDVLLLATKKKKADVGQRTQQSDLK
jgi:hypothetical protein